MKLDKLVDKLGVYIWVLFWVAMWKILGFEIVVIVLLCNLTWGYVWGDGV